MTVPTTTVLHVTEALGGGVQSAIAHFIEQTPDFRHVVFGRARAGEQTINRGSETITHVGGPLSFARRLPSVMRRVAPDTVHFHSSIGGALRPLARNTRVLYSPHCYAFERQDIDRFRRSVFRNAERILARFTDEVIAVSPHEATLAAQLSRSPAVVTVSNLGAVAPFIATSSDRQGVVSVGRLSAQKDPNLFADVARRTPNRHFTWIGDGDPEFRRTLEESGVEVTGWQSKDQIEQRLHDAGLYLHTAAWEASPMSLAEALAASLPIICRDEPSLRSLGYRCVKPDSASLSEAIENYFRRPDSRQEVLADAQAVSEELRAVPTAKLLRAAYLGRS